MARHRYVCWTKVILVGILGWKARERYEMWDCSRLPWIALYEHDTYLEKVLAFIGSDLNKS